MTKATGIKYSLKNTTLRYANEWRLYHLVHFVQYGRNILLLGLTENKRFTVMCSRSRQPSIGNWFFHVIVLESTAKNGQNACRTCSTIIIPLLTNHILAF